MTNISKIGQTYRTLRMES